MNNNNSAQYLDSDIDRWYSEFAGIDRTQVTRLARDAPIPSAGFDDFNNFIDQAGLGSIPGQLDTSAMLNMNATDLDWASFFNIPQSVPGAPSSVYSDHTATTAIPASPAASMVSDVTAVDTLLTGPIKGDFALNTFEGGQQVPPRFNPPVAYGQYYFGAFERAPPPPVMYYPPQIENNDNSLAFPLRFEFGNHGQPEQQHRPWGAVAPFVPTGLSMPASNGVAQLTPQPTVGVPETPTQVVAADAVPTVGTSSRKRARDTGVQGEKAPKRRKQSTEKTHQCPECGSMWARPNNLKTHILSVHKGERLFACAATDCGRAFSRKHDMQRHFQSEHTDAGSPRRKVPKA